MWLRFRDSNEPASAPSWRKSLRNTGLGCGILCAMIAAWAFTPHERCVRQQLKYNLQTTYFRVPDEMSRTSRARYAARWYCSKHDERPQVFPQ